jgi:predicted 3-demethylubiquinone-9 3-methyltransferase (glyoxalase superfamily)
MQRITPHLWFSDKAEEAAGFYVSIFPNSRVDRVTGVPADTPSVPAGSVKVVEFTLDGQPFMAISAGPLDPFNHAISFVVNCETEAEVDRYWNALVEGGSPEQCGWSQGPLWRVVANRADRSAGHDGGSRQAESEAGDGGDVEDGETGHCRVAARVRRKVSRS